MRDVRGFTTKNPQHFLRVPKVGSRIKWHGTMHSIICMEIQVWGKLQIRPPRFRTLKRGLARAFTYYQYSTYTTMTVGYCSTVSVL
jgi:hypothetical protein